MALARRRLPAREAVPSAGVPTATGMRLACRRATGKLRAARVWHWHNGKLMRMLELVFFLGISQGIDPETDLVFFSQKKVRNHCHLFRPRGLVQTSTGLLLYRATVLTSEITNRFRCNFMNIGWFQQEN